MNTHTPSPSPRHRIEHSRLHNPRSPSPYLPPQPENLPNTAPPPLLSSSRQRETSLRKGKTRIVSRKQLPFASPQHPRMPGGLLPFTPCVCPFASGHSRTTLRRKRMHASTSPCRQTPKRPTTQTSNVKKLHRSQDPRPKTPTPNAERDAYTDNVEHQSSSASLHTVQPVFPPIPSRLLVMPSFETPRRDWRDVIDGSDRVHTSHPAVQQRYRRHPS